MRHFNLLDISIYQIQLFLAVAEERNFSRAAVLMNLTQSALSKRIAALEHTVGMTLFQREKRPVGLTPEGECLYGLWKDVARKFELSIETAQACSRPPRQTLTVCMIDSGNLQAAIPLAGTQLALDRPGLSFRWEYSSFAHWRGKLLDKEIDIMFTLVMEAESLGPDFAWEQVIACPKLVCMLRANPLSTRQFITYDALKPQRFVVLSPVVAPFYYKYLKSICARHGFEPTVARYVPDSHTLIASLQDNNDVAVCDMFLRDINQPSLKTFELPDTYSGLIAVWRKDDTSPHIQEFLLRLKRNLASEACGAAAPGCSESS